MKALPIDEVLAELLRYVGNREAVVLKAPTGAGKTTRVPPALAPLVAGQVVVVEPRRIAARAAASRIAEEQGWKVGREVGYRIRFEDRSSAGTRVLFVTEGVLLAWLQRDPFLEGVGIVAFDEFHERSLAVDLGLAMVERIRSTVREDLGVVVMSATLESSALSEYLGGCPVVESQGRTYPVETRYLDRPDDRPLVPRTESAVLRELENSEGDVLVFLPGVGEIQRLAGSLSDTLESRGVELQRLFGDLPLDQQRRVLTAPKDRRRVILATNVAETSVTVEGVRTVIDTGVERRLEVDPSTGFDRLELRPISKSSAKQRAGRAGRLGPGRCLRLWTASEESQRRDQTPPEVRRVDLASALLGLVAWGESEPLAFPWFEAPDPGRVGVAMELLERLGAVVRAESRWTVTGRGASMSELGCHPRLAKLVLDCALVGEARRGALLAALLEERDVFRRAQHGWRSPPCRSDALERLEALDAMNDGRRTSARLDRGRARRVMESADQLSRRAKSSIAAGTWAEAARKEPYLLAAVGGDPLERLLLAAYPDRLARRRIGTSTEPSDRAVMSGGRGVRLAKSSGVQQAELFLALDVGRATAAVGEGGSPREALVFQASSVEAEWLDESLISVERTAELDDEDGRVRVRSRRMFGDLVLSERDEAPEVGEVEGALAALATDDPSRYLPLDSDDFVQLDARVFSLARWRPELEFPDVWETLPDVIPQLSVGCRNTADLGRAAVAAAVEGLLSWPQRQALVSLAPLHVDLPNGRRAGLKYSRESEAPILALQIQQLFGVRETPTVNGGRQPVLLHLLAPNQRPQQVTSDLAGFWSGTYALVKKDLAGRYPKHPWPDDPANAEPPRRRGGRRKR